MTTNQQQTWPEGVIARYLTVGGATVDLAERSSVYDPTKPDETVATCTGCGQSETVEWAWRLWSFTKDRMVDEFDEGGRCSTPKAREWAQAHAEKCRAMPRPAETEARP